VAKLRKKQWGDDIAAPKAPRLRGVYNMRYKTTVGEIPPVIGALVLTY